MGLAFHIENFGCRAARADGEAVSDRLRAAGLDERQPAMADVVVVNTCSVTEEADRAARAFIRRAHRLNPEARILVTGCYAQREPEKLAGLPGVAAVVGNSHKAFAPEIALNLAREDRATGEAFTAESRPGAHRLVTIQSVLAQSGVARSLVASTGSGLAPIWADDRFAHSFLEETQLMPGAQTRPNLKIQEGCGNRCTFCVIPETRGPSRSLPAASVLKQVRGFVAAGGNELVLSGINLGRWGRDFKQGSDEWAVQVPTLSAESRGKDGAPGGFHTTQGAARPSLADLVRQIFRDTDLPRLRLSSIEPMDWDSDLIALMREFGGSQSRGPGQRLARHAHLPLQSGSDTVLRRMHRRYRPWHYAEKVAALVDAAGPELTLGADVMVGFPGETDREFQETFDLVCALPFGYLHLFPFSPRPGTPGWGFHAQSPVPAAEVDERMAALRKLGAQKSEAHRMCFIGRTLEAITLHTPPALQAQGRTAALTENFLPVEIEGRLPANRLLSVRVVGLTSGAVLEAAAGDDAEPSKA